MAINKATLYEKLLDSVVQAGATSLPLRAKESMVQYSGGDTVKIAKISTTGFGTYSRTAGYPSGTASLDWGTYTIPYDRGVSFLIDVMDQDETAGMLSAGNLIAEFGNNDEVPEIDSARYMAIFQAIVDDAVVVYGYYTPVVATVLTQFNTDVSAIRAKCGRTPKLIAFMAETAFGVLSNSTQLSKEMMVQSVTGENGVTTDVYRINGVQIIPVPDDRLKTEYAFSATNGYSAKAWAMDMNWIICSPDAVVAFEKHRKVKVHSADVVQGKDGDLIETRLYHGCWVLDNKHNMIYISLKTAAADAVTGVVAGTNKVEITLGTDYTNKDTGHEFYYIDTDSATAPAVPAVYDELDISAWTKIAEATKVTVSMTATHYCRVVQLDENSRVVQYKAVASA